MAARYQTLRSVSDHHVFVICYGGRFYELPDHVRDQGPCASRRDRQAGGPVEHSLETGLRTGEVRARVFKPEA